MDQHFKWNKIEFVFIIPQWGNIPAAYIKDRNTMKDLRKYSTVLYMNCMTKKIAHTQIDEVDGVTTQTLITALMTPAPLSVCRRVN